MRFRFAVCLWVASCTRREVHEPPVDAGARDAETFDAAVTVTEDAAVADAGATLDAASAQAVAPDGGAPSCRLVYGPAEQPFRGPAALVAVGGSLRMVTNDGGRPRIYSVPVPRPMPKGSFVPPRPSTFIGVRWPPCELAGHVAYCQGPGGSVLRSMLDPNTSEVRLAPSKSIGQSRGGTRLAAAEVGGGHSVVAFLDSRRTTEGLMLQAFIAMDDAEPERLSAEGSGATSVRFVANGDRPVAVYIDTRTSMVPLHARSVERRNSVLALGNDVVVFVGGTPERGLDFTVARAGEKAFAFLPLPKDTLAFGVAQVPIDDPPKEDPSVVWSLYPNGLDPAPITAEPMRNGKGAWVARVRPEDASPASHRMLELTRVDAAGALVSFGEVGKGHVTDIALTEDPEGGVWLLYGDSTVTWLERRICPSAAP